MLRAAAIYTSLAVAWLWPIPLHPGAGVPDVSWWYDALLNIASLDALAEHLVGVGSFYDAPFFAPHQGVLRFTEQLPALAAVYGVLTALGATPVGAHSVMLVAAFALNGFCTWLLARRISRSSALAWVAGVVAMICPYYLFQMARIQLMCIFPLPLALLSVELAATARAQTTSWLRLSAALVLAWTTCTYYALLVTLLAGVTTLVHAVARPRASVAIAFGALGAVAAALLVVSPILFGYLGAAKEMGFERSLEDVRRWEPSLGMYVHTEPQFSPRVGTRLQNPGLAAGDILYPGTVGLVLAGLGTGAVALGVALGVAASVLRRRALLPGLALLAAAAVATLGLRNGSWTPAILAALAFGMAGLNPRNASLRAVWAAGLVAFALSLGPQLTFTGVTGTGPFRWLFEHVPGFAAIRFPGRLGIAAVALGAVTGVAALAALTPRRGLVRVPLAIVLAWVVVRELWPPPCKQQPVDGIAAYPGLTFLRDAPRGLTLHLPFRNSGQGPQCSITEDVRRMMHQLEHGQPIVNGMSGFDPPLVQAAMTVLPSFPDAEAVDLIRGLGIRWVHLWRPAFRDEAAAIAAWLAASPHVQIAFEGRDELVLRLSPEMDLAAPPDTGPGVPLPRGCRVFGPSGVELVEVTDGLDATRWTSGPPQRGGESVDVVCASPVVLSGWVLRTGPWTSDWPRQVEIQIPGDRGELETVATPVPTVDVSRLARAPLDHYTVFPIDPARRSAHWRLRQVGRSRRCAWSIAELRVLLAAPAD